VQSVEHPCHQCHAAIEDGVPFCPKCGAPQIRVVAEDHEPVTDPMPSGTPGEIYPPSPPVYGAQQNWQQITALAPGRIDWRMALPGAAMAGIGAGLLTEVPYLSLFSIFWLFLAGGFAVRLYQKRKGTSVGAKAGAKIGAVAGMFSFAITGISNTMKFVLYPGKMRESLQKSMQMSLESSTRNADPQSAKMLQDIAHALQTPEGLVLMLGITLAMLFVFLLVLGAAGGAGFAAMSKRSQPF
jgi:hypothetical protein